MIFEVLKSLGFPLAFLALSSTFLKGILPFSKGFRLELASKRGTFLAWNSEILGKFSQKPAKNTDLALAMSTKLDFLFYLVCKVLCINFEVKWKLLGQIRAVLLCPDLLIQVIWRMKFFGPPNLNTGQTDFIFGPYKVSELDNNICMADGIRSSNSCILERFFEMSEVWSLENFRFSTTFVLKTVC